MKRMKLPLRLAGTLLVLALCLSLSAPALAQIPQFPLLFSGDVTIGGVDAPVGTGITAEIEDVQVASATTTIVGRYAINIDYDAGYIGKTVVLKVEGAVGGSGTYVEPFTSPVVTVNLFVAEYTLTMAVIGNGSTTPVVGAHAYVEGTVVNITTTPDPGWQFDNWTGGDVADPGSDSTTVTMDADKTVTANFSEIPPTTYTLTMAVTGNGTTDPAVGDHDYAAATVVDITATPDAGWQFVDWTGAVADTEDATTTVTMDADKTVTANFSVIPGLVKLIGAASDVSDNKYHGANMICLTRFQAESNGNVTEVKVKAGTSGNVKVAIYADSTGAPGSLINSTGSNAVSAGWNTISITSTLITAGTYYWLAVKLDTTNAARYNSQSGTMRYKASIPYADAWPDPAGTGYLSRAFHGCLAGWGTIVTLPDPPIVAACGTSIKFGWNASALATKYWLQVSTDAGFGAGTIVFEGDEITTTSQIAWLCFGNTYFWRVSAGNANGWSAWSSVGSVTP